MKTADFDYHLPEELIAQAPAEKRLGSRLLVVGPGEQPLEDRQFPDLVDYCQPGDLLIMNNTRVIPARLQCRKPTGGRVEVMLERMLPDGDFLALARSSKTLSPGQRLLIGEREELEYRGREGDFFRFSLLHPDSTDSFKLFHRCGEMPLPPYIKRPPGAQDSDRYQTVYAQVEGAVAAPTAGLHFNREILQSLQQGGIDTAEVTLHVGAGTFQPVKVEQVAEHQMHEEWIEVTQELVERVQACRKRGGRVIAVGTTTVRALESAAQGGQLQAYSGPTRIFIYPGFRFHVVDLLLTNFHLPRSTLLMMISAFAGIQEVKAAYQHAVEARYRFFSYGDAMLLARQNQA